MIIEKLPRWNPPSFVYGFVGALLLIAVAPLPYGYYKLLRLIVSGLSIVIVYQNFKLEAFKRIKSLWLWSFIFIAILFNPIISIHLKKEIWIVINIITGILFFFLAYQTYIHEKEQQKEK